MVEWSGELPDHWGERRPHLGALGNALVWRGAATLEAVIVAFQTWMVTLSPGRGMMANELAGLVAVEVLALLATWLARFLWTRSKEMLRHFCLMSRQFLDGNRKNEYCAGLL